MKRRWLALERMLPVLLMGAGVALLGAGVLSYSPSALGDRPATPTTRAGDPLFPASPAATGGGLSPHPTPIVIGSAGPSPPGPPAAVATHIRIPALDIDLPVVAGDLAVAGNPDNYPLCDVALYLPTFAQPGTPGTTYIYAHAQRGMFLPLLEASQLDDGAGLVGVLVEVYTSADELHLYEVVTVKRHATDLSLATDAGTTEQLVLQTSEGPTGTLPKLQVAARPVSVIRAAASEARPSPQPRVCAPS